MKKMLLFLAIFALCRMPGAAQTVYWAEDFSSNAGWTLQQNWSISGGKLQFYWSPTVTNFDLSAISPPVELHANIQELIVNQHLNAYSASNPPETAEIYVISGDTEYLLWSHTLNMGNWGNQSGSEIDFDISDLAGQTVQFKFRTFGLTTFNWNWWQVFDLKLTAMFDHDLAAQSLTGPNSVNANQTGTWSFEVKNFGSQPQSEFSVSMYSLKFGSLIGTINVTEPIQPQQTLSFDFDWTPSFAHNTALYAVVNFEGDEFPANNVSESHFVRVKPELEISVLVWDWDNGISTVVCPEQGDLIRPTMALTRALDKTGITYQLENILPQSLEGYDIVFASLGCYCLS